MRINGYTLSPHLFQEVIATQGNDHKNMKDKQLMNKSMSVITYAVFVAYVILRPGTMLATTDAASAAVQPRIQPNVHIALSQQKDSAIRLEVRQTPLAQILKEIATKTGANIHYSVLPEAPVTATCVGANVGQIMDCLVAKQVGLVAHKPQKDKPAEFWLLAPVWAVARR